MKLTVLRKVVREKFSSTCIESSETVGIRGLNDRLAYVCFHGEPAERQTPIVGMFLVLFEYIIGLCVIPRTAGDQMYLSAGCAR